MKIAYIMKSEGLEYDDRIRKEMASMRTLLGEVEFKIFAFDGNDNHSGTGVLSYGVPFEFVAVRHRSGKRKDVLSMILKEYNFYAQVKEKVKDYDLLWICDSQPFFFPLFSRKPVIWDLHEIPALIIGSKIKNLLFHRMERRCRWLIHANQERIDYLASKGVLARLDKNLILRNYPDKDWLSGNNKQVEKFQQFKDWLGNEEYVYLQGLGSEARYPYETLKSIMEAKLIKAVVIGRVQKDAQKRIEEEYPDADNYIYYAGQMIQGDTATFIAHSKFSMVFYHLKTPNNRYCEPNRMFQCLGYGKPVVVGCNEPMKNVVEENRVGIALPSDGGNINDNVVAIQQMMDNYDAYHKQAETKKETFAWESQISVFSKLFNI